MRRFVVVICLLVVISKGAFGDTTIWSVVNPSNHSDLYNITLTALSVPVYASGGVYYYQGSSLPFSLYKSEQSDWWTASWWVVITDGTNTPVNATNSDPDTVSVPFSIGGDYSLYLDVWSKYLGFDTHEYSASFAFRGDAAAPALTITPTDNNWHNVDVLLTVTATDARSGVNPSTWQYSWNNVNWSGISSGSSTITFTDAVSGANTIYFRVADHVGNWGSQSATVKLDKNPPTVTPRVVTSGGLFGSWTTLSSALVTADVSDALNESGIDTMSRTYSINGGTAQTWDGQPVTISTLGTSIIEFTVKDLAGNSRTSSGAVMLDPTAPTVTVSNFGWTSQNVILTQALLQSLATLADQTGLSGLNQSTLTYQITSGPAVINGGNPITAAVTPTLSIAGDYTLTVKIKDNAGNEGIGIGHILIDKSGPTIALDSQLEPNPGIKWSNASAFVATANDAASGVDSSTWQWAVVNVTEHPELAGIVPTSGWAPGSSALIPTGLDGQYQVWYRVSDNAGNSSTTTVPGFVKIDRTGPVISDASTGWIKGTSLGSQATDSGVGVDQSSWAWSTDGTTWQAGLPSQLASGLQTIWLRVADSLGNETTRQLTVQIDNDPPAVTAGIVTSGVLPATWTNAASVTVSATADDALSGINSAGWQYSLNGGVSWSNGSSVTLASEGQTTITFKARDNAGNEGTASVAVWIARTLPAVSVQIDTTGVFAGVWTAADSVTVQGEGTTTSGAPIDPSKWTYSTDGGVTWIAAQSATITTQGKTTVLFKASDVAGNQGTGQIALWIDRTGPTLSATAASYGTESNGQLSVSAPSATDPLSGVDWASFLYSLDSDSSLPLPFSPTVGGGIPTAGLAEGQHTLTISAADAVGNRSTSSVSFIVDRTPPTVASVSITASNGTIGEDQYGTGSSVQLQVNATDTFGGSSPGTGTVAGIRYVITQAWPTSPDFSQAQTSQGSDPVLLNGLANGINYLFLKVIDGAGNTSSPFTRIVRMDNGRPPVPTIVGLTHPRAVSLTDAVSISNAVFLISVSSTSGSGLKGFHYVLRKGQTVKADGVLAAGVENRLELTALPDNDQAEYYTLVVSAVGGNGIESDQSVPYQFRIDTSPPEHLTAIASSHSNPEVWYPSSRETFLWQQPADMTGVKTFYYTISRTQIALPPTPADAALFDLSTWTSTTSSQIGVDLKDVLSQTTGAAWFALCAEDYAGNRQFDEVSLHYDTVRPTLGTLPSGTGSTGVDTSRAAEKAAAVSWGDPHDDNEGSEGAPQVSVQLSTIDLSLGTPAVISNWQVMADATRSLTFEGLSTGAVYLATFRVADGAGNTALYTQTFSLDGTTLPSTASVPFSESINGYRIYGTRQLSGQGFDAYLHAPVDVSLVETSQNATAGDIHLDAVEFDAAGDVLTASTSDARSFSLSVQGFAINAAGLALDSGTGLSFATATYTTQVTRSGTSQGAQLDYSNVDLTFPPLVQFSSSSLNVVPAFSLPTFHRVSSVSGGEPDLAAGWILGDVTTSRLSDSYWQLSSATIDSTDLFNNFSIDASVTDASGTHRSIPVSNVLLTTDHVIAQAQVTTGFSLTLSGSTFAVSNAQVRGNQLVILEAQLALPSGYTPATVAVRNFSVDSDGKVVEGADFAMGSFSFIDASGNVFTVTKADFQGTNLVVTQGSVQTASGNQIGFDGLRLTSDGAAWDLPVSLQGSFSFSLHGYTVSSQNAQLTADSVVLTDATVSGFPVQFGGGAHSLKGLGVRLSDYSVTQAGQGNDAFSFVPAYGTAVSVTGIEMNATGLFASQFSVVLPQGLGGGSIGFSNMQLASDGTLGLSDARQDPFTINAHGYAAQGNSGIFDGATVTFPTVHVVLSASASVSELDFVGLKVSGLGVVTSGTYAESVSWNENGWSYSLASLALSDLGVTATATLSLPADFGNRDITFPQFSLLSDGTSSSGSATDSFYVRIFGWKVLLTALSVQGSSLLVGTGAVPLYSTMGDGQLVVPDIVLDSSGQVLSSGSGGDTVQFLAENGFLVDATSYTFASDGLRLGGSIHFPDGLGDTAVAGYDTGEILLSSDGTVQTQSKDAPVNYSIGGWKVEAHGYSFDADGLTVENSYADVPSLGIRLSFPSLSFYPDGGIKAGGANLEGFTIPLFGGNIGVTQIQLTKSGVNLACFITLPENLGGFSIYFDQLTLHPDGTVSTDAAVPEFAFSVENFDFLFRNIKFDAGVLSIGEAQLTLPPEMDGKQIHLYNFSIDSNGNFQLGGLGFDPFQMWGYTFAIDNIGFANNVISFEGSITLPDTFVTGLAGKTIKISDFKVTTAGVVQSFDVSLQGTLEFALGDSWTVDVDTIGIQKEAVTGTYWFTINKGTLKFPPGMGIADASISGVKINPLTAAFTFDNVTIDGVQAEAFGLSFYLDKITISSTFDMDFSGRVTLPDTASMPEPIRGKTITVSEFQISHDGNVGNVAGGLSGIEGSLWDTLYLSNSAISFSKQTGGLLLSVTGDVQFMSAFPAGIAGQSVHLSAFTLDTSTWSVTAFAAQSDPLSFDLFNSTHIENAVIGMHLDQSTGGVVASVTGAIVLPSSLPAVLAGRSVVIQAFTINLSSGTISAFGASLALPGEQPLFAGIDLKDANLGATYESVSGSVVFTISGSLVLSSTFPTGLAGTVASINTLVFDSAGSLRDLNANVAFPDQKLFDTLAVRNGTVTFVKSGSSNMLISVSGDVILPDSFPKGLGGLPIHINTFTVDSSGTIQQVDIAASGINVPVFDAFSLQNGAVHVTANGSSDFIFSVTGSIVLPSSLPQGLAGLTLSVTKLDISSQRGLLAFTAGVTSNIDFDLFAGIKGSFTTLALSQSGFELKGTLTLPLSFPEGLAGMVIALDDLQMTWNGQITAISAGIASAQFSLAGFTANLTDLMFQPTGISIGSLLVTLPANMGSKVVGVENAGWDSAGNFHGNFVIPEIDIDIAGFTLALVNPSLDVPNQQITFSQAKLGLPDFLGNASLAVNGVKVNPSGLVFTGGAFAIPDFTIAGGLGFKNIHVNFSIDGSAYFIEGGGSAFVPGAGTFEATVSFTNQSPTYPIGLKRAFFSYEVSGLGLPLATTGLYLNGIRGGIAFGPPDEVPTETKYLFPNPGTRLQLGIAIGDAFGGATVKGKMDVWVDVTNWTWAFEGNVAVLSGYFNADLIAAFNARGFYGKVKIELRFVRGQVELWIGDSRVAGAGSVQFGIPTGFIVDYWFWFWGYWHVVIPDSDWFLPPVNAEFGHFSSGQDGFKGWIDLPIIGSTGIFLPNNGTPVLGNVSQFTLVKPMMAVSSTFAAKGMAAAPSVTSTATAAAATPTAGSSISGRVVRLDKLATAAATEVYQFTVPGTAKAAATSSAKSLAAVRDIAAPATQVTVGNVERITFVLGVAEGDPQLVAVSPSGARIAAGDANVLIQRTSWGSMMAVLNPEPGIWSAEVSGAVSSDSYSLSVLGTTATPQITVSDPSYSGMLVDKSVTVSGTAFANNGALGTVTVYASNDSSSFNGVAVGTATPQANGSFTVQVDTSSLIDGEYWLFAGIRPDAKAPEKRAYAPGSINVLHYQPLAAVTDFVAGENKAGGIDLHFTDPNSTRTLGFNLHVKDVTSGEASTIYMGHLTDTSLPGFTAGHTYQLQVGAKDAANREGALSPVITLAMGSVKQPINDFTIGANQLDAALKIGEVTQGILTVNTVSATTTNSAYDYVIANVVSTPAGLNLGFTAPVSNLSGGNASVGYTLYPQESVAPGSYQVVLALTNQGNASETHQITISVTVGYPKVTVTQVSPTRWNTEKAQVVDVYGTNFFSGTRVFIEANELTVTAVDSGHVQANAPAGLAAGTHTITVMGPGSDTATATVTLIAPDYQILAYKSMTVVQPGGSGAFFYTIQALNDFTGTVTFSLQDIPSGWSATLDRSTLAAGELATVSVTVPTGAPTGTSTLNVMTSAGDVLPLDVTVSATTANPTISGLSESAGFVGDSVSIYGYGFGTNATAMLGTTALPITTRGVDVITVQIPQDAASGDITVSREGMVSNAVPFYVKSLGFTIYPDAKTLTMQPGESRTINLWVSGYAQAVGLSASTNDSNVSAHLAGTQVIPNGSVALTFEVPASAAKGSYPVTITGVSGNVTNTAVITVSVGAAFSIDTTVLPNGMEGVDYLAQVKTSDGTDPVEMTIDSGRLPYGLTLESDGTISGRPSETGTLRFTLRAIDGDRRNRTQALSITVTENAWAQDAKDGGRTRFNPVPSPADSRVMWTSAGYTGARAILTGHARAFLLTTGSVVGLDQETGRLLYRISGNFTQWAYAGGNLYLLDSGGTFTAVESLSGNKLWTRTGVQRFTTDGSTIVLSTSDGAQVVDTATGSLGAVLASGLDVSDLYLWQNGALLDVHQNTVSRLSNGAWQVVYYDPTVTIVDAAADTTNLFLLTQAGRLVMLDAAFTGATATETDVNGGQLALGDTRIEVAGSSVVKVYSRSDLSQKYTSTATVSRIAAASEKLFVAGSAGLRALNGYDGTMIWSNSQAFLDVAIAGQSVYGLSAAGTVLRFNAADNLNPPTTVISAMPAAPDGENGYYINSPLVSLTAHDPETYVSGSWYRYGELSYTPYTAPFALPDGLLSVLAYSVDSKGFRELEKTQIFHVDTKAPVTTLGITGILGSTGYYLTGVSLSLSATDTGSGVDWTEYTLNGITSRYSADVSLSSEGIYIFSYRSKDIAGNWGVRQIATFLIDLYAPTASTEVVQLPGAAVVYLSGADTGSGVDHLEYSVDGGGVMSYADPIGIPASGTHTVVYHAVDKAGRTSDWQTVQVVVPVQNGSEWIKDLRFDHEAQGRKVVTNVQVGQALYWPTNGRNNKIASLPSYLVGADFIMTNVSDAHGDDRGPFMTFTAGTDIDVYVMKNRDSRADFTGWTLVERNYPVEPQQYFRGGADIYKLSVAMGSVVSIPYSAIHGEGGGNLVFVQKAASASVWITSPMPGEELAPLSTARYAYLCEAGRVVSQQWWVRYGNGAWTSLGTAASGSYNLPYTDTSVNMDLRLNAQLMPAGATNAVAVEKLTSYQIVNKASFTLTNPGLCAELLAGEKVELKYTAVGIAGETLPAGSVSWQDSRDGKSWLAAEVDANGVLTVPQKRGAYWLKAIMKLGLPEGSGAPESRTYTYRFMIVDQFKPVTIEMGRRDGLGEYADGSVVSTHPSGRVYGFAPDHTDQRGSFLAYYFYPRPRRGHEGQQEVESYIRLLDGGYFEYDAGAGRYKVTVYVAPVGRFQQETLKVNGASYAIKGTRDDESMMKVLTETTVSDGKVIIGGTEGLPLMRVVIEKLTPSAPVVKPTVSRVENVWIWDMHGGWGDDHDGKR